MFFYLWIEFALECMRTGDVPDRKSIWKKNIAFFYQLNPKMLKGGHEINPHPLP